MQNMVRGTVLVSGAGRQQARSRHRYPSAMTLPAVRKISERIVNFGEPLIHQLDPDQPYEVVGLTFEIVILISC
jgi:hypothetical protein